MGKSKQKISPGKKAMLNEAKSDNAKGKKQVLKVRGQKESKELPNLKSKPAKEDKFNAGMPEVKPKDKKKKKPSGKSNVPNPY